MARSLLLSQLTKILTSLEIYRCWVVYERPWVVIVVPALCWVSATALTVYILITRTRGALEITEVPSKSIQAFVASQCAVTITVNIYATDRKSKRVPVDVECRAEMRQTTSPGKTDRTDLRRVMRILIESGFFYTLGTVADLICTINKSNLSLVVSAINIVVIGIIFNSIVIRVAAERARLRKEAVGESQMTTLKFASNLPFTTHSLAAHSLASQPSTARGTDQDVYEKEDLYS
ncbi:hypothetical protein D9613_009637 [Agrocybe pediades]|uniref:Uncharacterized protein n=1 Tax=Agrocybe pediades TaxID=84607 RepID=A0A8H4VW43_9AGAR|nr:hypothetical protein D9613_009637 [Agrocybe pediades]